MRIRRRPFIDLAVEEDGNRWTSNRSCSPHLGRNQQGSLHPLLSARLLRWTKILKPMHLDIQASSSRFTEYVEAQSNVSHFTCDATGEVPILYLFPFVNLRLHVPRPFQSSPCFQEDEPAADPTLHSEEVLNEAPSEKVEPTPEAELISSMTVDLEYVQRVCARNNAAGPSSNNVRRLWLLHCDSITSSYPIKLFMIFAPKSFQTRQITTVVRQTTSHEEEDEGGFPLLGGYCRGRELMTSLPSAYFLFPEISQDNAGVQVSIGFKKHSRRNRNRRRWHRSFSRHFQGNGSNLNKYKSLLINVQYFFFIIKI